MRRFGITSSAVFAGLATWWLLYAASRGPDVGAEGALPFLVMWTAAAALGWLGVIGWMTRRRSLMVIGAWGVLPGLTVLWSAIVAPFAFAVFTTVAAVRRARLLRS